MSARTSSMAGGLAPLLVVLVSVVVGGTMAFFGPVALLVVAGAAGAVLMIRKPFWGVLLLAATLPVENATLFASGMTATRIVGLGLATGWLAGKILRNESFSRVLSASVTWLSLAFLTLVLSSTFWAMNTDAVRSGFIRLVQMVALGVIVLDVIDSWDDVHKLCRVFIFSGIIGAGLTLYDSMAGTAVRAGEGVAGINGTAELLVTLMPCAFYLLVAERTFLWRLLAVVYIGVGSGAVLGTLSRLSMMLLPVVILIMTVQTLRAGRGRGWLLVGFAAITIGVFSQEDSFARLERRIESILPYLTTTVQRDEEGLSGRGYHLAVGVEIFKDHPIVGVGYENFGDYFLYRYQYIVPGGNSLWQSRRSPHSSHVGIMADLGAVGLLLWVSILGVAIAGVWRANRRPDIRRDRSLTTLTFGLLVSLLLQAGPYAMYGPNQKSKLMWVLLGLGVAVWRLARTAPDPDYPYGDADEEGDGVWWIEGQDVEPRSRVGALTPTGPGGLG